MCLSTVYMDEKKREKVVVEEASGILCRDNTIELYTLLGDRKILRDCVLAEVNLLEHYAILKRTRGDTHEGS